MTAVMPGANRSHTKILDGYDPTSGTWSEEDGDVHVVHRLLTALRTGCSLRSACAYARTSPSTVIRWREAGRSLMGDGVDRLELEIGERVFYDLAAEMEHILGRYEVELAGIVRAECRHDAKLALAVLSRRFPNHWQERKAVDVTSDGGPLVQDQIARLLSADPRLAVAGEAFALALEEAAAGEVVDAPSEVVERPEG